MPDLLKDKVVVITGAGSGIGREMAILFHKEGANVVAVDVVEKGLTETASIIGKGSENLHSLVLDLIEPSSPDKMIAAAVDTYGRIDILCNNAGIMDMLQSVTEITDEFWNRVMDVNITAPFRATRAAIPHMLKQGHGIILNTASIAGLFGGKAGAVYTASKHALIGLTRNTASYYRDDGIRCNAMVLGGVATPLGYGRGSPSEHGLKVIQKSFPMMPKPADPKDVAKVALFLVSDQSTCLNGSIVIADSGWTAQ